MTSGGEYRRQPTPEWWRTRSPDTSASRSSPGMPAAVPALRGWRQAADAEGRDKWWLRLLVETRCVQGFGCRCGLCAGCRDVWALRDAPVA